MRFEVDAVRAYLGTKAGLVVSLLIAGLGLYLLWTHTGHVFLALPYLFLLACPLMHFFGHGSHRHHDHSGTGKQPADSGASQS